MSHEGFLLFIEHGKTSGLMPVRNLCSTTWRPHILTGCLGLHGLEYSSRHLLRRAHELQDFGNNYAGDSKVKIPWVRRDLCGARVLVMEWIDGMRCTNIRGIQTSGIDVNEFIRCGVVSGLRQLLEVRQHGHSARFPGHWEAGKQLGSSGPGHVVAGSCYAKA